MPDFFVLNAADKALFQGMLDREKRRTRGGRVRPADSDDDPTAPETYIARTPLAGIPAISTETATGTGGASISTGTGSAQAGNTPGSALCEVFRVLKYRNVPDLVPVRGLKRVLHNISRTAVPGRHWVLATRDKWGSWFAVPTPTPATPAGGGSLAVNTTNNGTGDTTVSKSGVTVVQIDQASGLKETSVDAVTAKVAAQSASATHSGVVNLTDDQQLGDGDKVFGGHVGTINGNAFWYGASTTPGYGANNFHGRFGETVLFTQRTVDTLNNDRAVLEPFFDPFSTAIGSNVLSLYTTTWDLSNNYSGATVGIVVGGGGLCVVNMNADLSYNDAQYIIMDFSGLLHYGQWTTIPNTFNNIYVSGGLITGWD